MKALAKVWFYSFFYIGQVKLQKFMVLFLQAFNFLWINEIFLLSFFRQPDSHIGYIFLDALSMGQILCVPMIVIGFIMLFYSRKTS